MDSPNSRTSVRKPAAKETSFAVTLGGIILLVVSLLLSAAGVGIGVLWQATSAVAPIRDIQGALDYVTVQGRHGAVPVVTIDRPLDVGLMKEQVLVRGEGREILENTPVLMAIYPFSATDGKYLGTDNRGQLRVSLATEAALGAELSGLVIGQTEGSRILVVRPTNTGQTEINVVDILSSIANGQPVDPVPGPLSVMMADEGPIISHTGEPPAETTVQMLLQGEGPQVHAGDDVVVQYLALSWTNGTVLASSWAEGIPQSIKIDDAMVGLQEALIDQRVGSRLAITVPPDAANGDDTLAIVVDILGSGPAK